MAHFFVFVSAYLVCIFGSSWCLLGILKHLTNEERIAFAIKGGGAQIALSIWYLGAIIFFGRYPQFLR